ncbi:MAG: DUF4168 domain-containing protein [Geminicoccaceae bacterium]|nr:MAG: DUF4168 domain-containing protein [Geminicoccaceae bacterium]
MNFYFYAITHSSAMTLSSGVARTREHPREPCVVRVGPVEPGVRRIDRRPTPHREEPTRMPKFLLATTAALALWAFAPLVPATPVAADRAFAQGAAPGAEIGDEALRRFAVAALEVQEIGRTWQEAAQQAQTEAEMESLREDAQSQMVEAVENEGLTVDDYNAIVAAAEADPELAARIQALIIEESTTN